jgi:outer membrane protein W
MLSGLVRGQATDGQFVADFGVAYAKATADDAKSGFIGLDIFGGKMLTNNICLGLSAGVDIASYEKIDNFHSRLAIIPVLLKAKYYLSLGPMLQVYLSGAGGAYIVSPHTDEPVGGLDESSNRIGGAVGVGIDYWFLLLQGVGFSFEYHIFDTDAGDNFTYYVARVEYSIIKF